MNFDDCKIGSNVIATTPENELEYISQQVEVLENRLKEYKAIETEQKSLKSKLKTLMEVKGIKKWETLNGTQITLVADTPDEKTEIEEFNLDKFKEENPDLYTNYLEKKTKLKLGRSGYVKITLPKD